MQKTILFDIDDTITRETEFMLRHAPGYLRRKYHRRFPVANPDGYDVSEVFGLREYFAENALSDEEVLLAMRRTNSAFWNKYFVRYLFYPIRKDAAKTIRCLRKQGYRICFASLRGRKTHETESRLQKTVRERVVPFLTALQLKWNFIPYDSLKLVESNEEKIAILREMGAGIVFDDNISVLEGADAGVLPVCIETIHNRHYDFQNPKVVRIPFEFQRILALIPREEDARRAGGRTETVTGHGKKRRGRRKLKTLKWYQIVFTEAIYQFVRLVGSRRVLEHYKPIVLGADHIPEGRQATVFVGNHRNIKDPIITIALLKKPTHFAALKRMFEYRDNMFGAVGRNIGTVATTVFVRSIGALPIARPEDKDYRTVNLQTFKYIDDYLRRGSAVAIYPEGTLNREPDKDGNLLPLKSDHSFRIAEKGKAVVVPVAIVWLPKELAVENRVMISFLQPIYTEDMCAKAIQAQWLAGMDRAISSMNRIVEELTRMNNDPAL